MIELSLDSSVLSRKCLQLRSSLFNVIQMLTVAFKFHMHSIRVKYKIKNTSIKLFVTTEKKIGKQFIILLSCEVYRLKQLYSGKYHNSFCKQFLLMKMQYD